MGRKEIGRKEKHSVHFREFKKGTSRVMLARKAQNEAFIFLRKRKVECIFSLRNRWRGKDDNTRQGRNR